MNSNLDFQLTFPAPFYSPGDSVADVVRKTPFPEEHIDRAIPIEGTGKKGYSPIFRNKLAKDGLILTIHPQIRTFYDVFQSCVKIYTDHDFLGFRAIDKSTGKPVNHYDFFTYKEGSKLITQIGSGLVQLFQDYHINKKKAIVGIHLPNSYHFPLIDLGCQSYSIVNTSLYDTLNTESMAYILNLTQVPIVFTNKLSIPTYHQLITEKNVKELKIVVTVENLNLSIDYELFELANEANFLLLDFQSLLSIGEKNPKPHQPPNPEDLYTISFTSGTTDQPKGAELTHQNGVCSIVNSIPSCGTAIHLPLKNRKTFTFLPLAHIFERSVFFYHMVAGNTICFPRDPKNVLTFFDDIKLVKPNDLVVVPRIINRIEIGLKARFKNSTFINNIINNKIEALKKGETFSHFIYDRFICPKLKAALGFDNLGSFVSGSAPISTDSLYYMQAAFNIPIVQGYGSTEGNASVCASWRDTTAIGNTGTIGPGLEMRLRDIPEMNYEFNKNRSGELLIRGGSITKNYFKKHDLFKESIDEDGWFCTGDVARLDKVNHMYIIDRVKNFFKLSQGKYIAAEKIQNTYLANALLLEQLFVYGDSLQSYLVGIAGLNIENAELFFKSNNLNFDFENLKAALAANDTHVKKAEVTNFNKVVNHISVKKLLLRSIEQSINDEELVSFERLKNAYFSITPFSIEEGTLTPSLKIKRALAKTKYQQELDVLYKEGQILSKPKL